VEPVKIAFLRASAALGLVASLASAGCSEDPKPTPAAVKPVSAGSFAQSEVLFPSATTLDQAALEALPESERTHLGESKVPVLVPKRPLLETKVMVEPGFYAFHGVEERALADGRISRATVAIQGTRYAHVHEDFPTDVTTHRMRKGRGTYTVNEGVVTTTFVENGATYSVDVECSVATDSRCADESYVIALTDALAFVGGRP
jgi:hypothetical protein